MGWNGLHGMTFPSFYENSITSPEAGWIAYWDSLPKLILVNPGATEVISTLRVVSPFGAAPGIYSIDLQLTNETGSSGDVFAYRLYRNGITLPTLTNTPVFIDLGYEPWVTNAYVVRSVDFANNESTASNAFVLGVSDIEPPTAPENLSGSRAVGSS